MPGSGIVLVQPTDLDRDTIVSDEVRRPVAVRFVDDLVEPSGPKVRQGDALTGVQVPS
jgi:hypothetical protein